MLAEIYFLRLETLMRASEEATLAENSRFVPLDPAFFRDVQMRGDGRKALGATGLIARGLLTFQHDRQTWRHLRRIVAPRVQGPSSSA
jgi:hypothetical protein